MDGRLCERVSGEERSSVKSPVSVIEIRSNDLDRISQLLKHRSWRPTVVGQACCQMDGGA